MGKLTVLALRIVLVALLAGSLFVQAVMVPLLAGRPGGAGRRVRGVPAPFAGDPRAGHRDRSRSVLVCVWRLLTMVRPRAPSSPTRRSGTSTS